MKCAVKIKCFLSSPKTPPQFYHKNNQTLKLANIQTDRICEATRKILCINIISSTRRWGGLTGLSCPSESAENKSRKTREKQNKSNWLYSPRLFILGAFWTVFLYQVPVRAETEAGMEVKNTVWYFKYGRETGKQTEEEGSQTGAGAHANTHMHTHTQPHTHNPQRKREDLSILLKMNQTFKHQSLCLSIPSGSDNTN